MKKFITFFISIAIVFSVISCGDGTNQKTIPNPAPDTANVYGPGVDTIVSWKVFKAKFHKGKLETCPGEFRQVKWYSIDSTGSGNVRLTLQGPKLTPDQLREMFNPAPITVDDIPSTTDENETVSGSENSGDSSGGFWTSPNWLGIPWWIWLLIGLILLAILWRLLSGRDGNGNVHHTHTHNHTHEYTPFVRQHQQAATGNQQNTAAQSHNEGHSHQTVSSDSPQRYVIRNGRVTINNARGNSQHMDVQIDGGEVEINNN